VNIDFRKVNNYSHFCKPNIIRMIVKNKYFLLLVISLLLSTLSYGQSIQGAIAIGTNLTQVDGDEMYGFKKFGLNASAIAIMPIKKRWAISVEASYSQKGSREYYPPEVDPTKELPYYDLRLSYAEVPIMVHFTDKGFLTVGLGMSWGRLVGMKEIEWNIQTDASLYSGHYNRNDINGIFDLRFPIYKKLNLNFRYAYSFAKIRTREYNNLAGDSWKRDQYNNVLTLRFYYIFNERKNYSND